MKVLKVVIRIYLNPVELDKTIDFYENIFGEKCLLRFKHAELELAMVGYVLLIAGSDEALRPFRNTQATFLVDSLNDLKDKLVRHGAVIMEGTKKVPTGANMRVKHPDGTVIEYVEQTGL